MTISGCDVITVEELIAHLQTFPQKAYVLYPCYSDWAALGLDEIRYIKKSDKKLVYRNDGVQDTYPENQWGDEQPVYVEAIIFPG